MVLCKHGSFEGEIRKIAVQGRVVVGSLGCMIQERSVSREGKIQIWVWNERQTSRLQAVASSYLRGACGVLRRMDGKSNERVYSRFGKSYKGEVIKCRVVQWIKRSTLKGRISKARIRQSDRVRNSPINHYQMRGKVNPVHSLCH